jgi:glc operon protein GlcG
MRRLARLLRVNTRDAWTRSFGEQPMSPFRLIAGIALVVVCVARGSGFADDRPAADEPLISRGRIQLNLAGAETVVGAAKEKALALRVKVNIAVVDDGGQMVAFARMDGARPASVATALTKAVAAATFRQETGPLRAKGEPDLLLNLSLQNAAMAGGGKLTTLKGGVPIVVEGQVIGGVGIAGGSGEQDLEVAQAAYQSLLAALGGRK